MPSDVEPSPESRPLPDHLCESCGASAPFGFYTRRGLCLVLPEAPKRWRRHP